MGNIKEMSNIPSPEDMPQIQHEANIVHRIRSAVQFCKGELGMQAIMHDHEMGSEQRMEMEKCLISNYLIPRGMNYFGNRDLIYIDMQGDKDIGRMYTRELAETQGGDDE